MNKFDTDKYFTLPYCTGALEKSINNVSHYCAFGAALKSSGIGFNDSEVSEKLKMSKWNWKAIVRLNDGFGHTEGNTRIVGTNYRSVKENPIAARKVLYNVLKHFNVVEEKTLVKC